jgi:hypothetical protein
LLFCGIEWIILLRGNLLLEVAYHLLFHHIVFKQHRPTMIIQRSTHSQRHLRPQCQSAERRFQRWEDGRIVSYPQLYYPPFLSVYYWNMMFPLSVICVRSLFERLNCMRTDYDTPLYARSMEIVQGWIRCWVMNSQQNYPQPYWVVYFETRGQSHIEDCSRQWTSRLSVNAIQHNLYTLRLFRFGTEWVWCLFVGLEVILHCHRSNGIYKRYVGTLLHLYFTDLIFLAG